MPTTQVINYQQDPGQAQIQSFGKDIAETIQKKQALQQTADYYKILAKNAETEIEKVKNERKAKTADALYKVSELAAKDPEGGQRLFGALMDAKAIDFEGVHDVASKAMQYHEQFGKPTKMAEASLASEQGLGAQRNSDANLNNALIEKLNNLKVPGQGGASSEGQAPDGTPSDIPNMVPGDINIKGFSFDNPQSDYWKGRASKLGTESVPEATGSQKDQLRAVDTQLALIDSAEARANKIKSVGPVQGRFANVKAGLTGGENDSNYKAYVDFQPTLALGIYGAISGDNSKLSDQDAMLRAAPLIWRPQEGEGLKVKKEKFALARKTFEVRKKMLKEGTYTVGKDGSLITPMEQVLRRAQRELDGNSNGSRVDALGGGSQKIQHEGYTIESLPEG